MKSPRARKERSEEDARGGGDERRLCRRVGRGGGFEIDGQVGGEGGRERERGREREAVTGIDTGTAICVHRWIHVLEHGCDQEQVRVWRSAWSL